MINVEIFYIPTPKQTVRMELKLPEGSTVSDALNHSKIYSTYPETNNLSVGIFSKKVDLTTLLKEGDRIEIYRPLIQDPKDNRRKRAQSKSKLK